ncbi:hypothetical protein [Flavobacterium sp.]|uniref:type II secretion system protein n=1 Tax=Flavobacterium sp. TaxID=239 RepID=UPI00263563C0|nr:hypothetical protein [Flavobacterium sp.]
MINSNFQRKHRQQGYLMVELAITLVISAILLTQAFSKIIGDFEEMSGKAVGQYLIQLQGAINRYSIEHYTEIVSGAAIPGFAIALQPTVDELRTKNYLPPNFSSVSPLNLSYKTVLKVSGGPCPPATTCTISGMTFSTSAYKDISGVIRNDILASAVTTIGNDGAQALVGNNGNMTGVSAGSCHALAADYGTQEGMVGICVGDNTGVGSLLSQFYKLDGTRTLTGDMNAGNKNLNNVGDINQNATGTAALGTVNVSNSLSIMSTAAANSSCTPGEDGKLKQNTTSPGLVICKNGTWTQIGIVVPGIGQGVACSNSNQLGTDTAGTGYICNGTFWNRIAVYANIGDACSPAGITAANISDNRQLICRNGAYMLLVSSLSKNVQVGPHLIVNDGTVVAKPSCDAPGVPTFSLGLTQAYVDVSQSPPYQGTVLNAVNTGSTWTVQLKLQMSAADGGNLVSGNNYSMSAVMTVECSY